MRNCVNYGMYREDALQKEEVFPRITKIRRKDNLNSF